MPLTARTADIPLSRIAGHIEPELVAEAAILRPGDEPDPIIVEDLGRSLDIVDGYHRAAGFLAWASANEIDPASVEIRAVIASGDEDVIGDAAEPGAGQGEAIAAIYEAAGVEA